MATCSATRTKHQTPTLTATTSGCTNLTSLVATFVALRWSRPFWFQPNTALALALLKRSTQEQAAGSSRQQANSSWSFSAFYFRLCADCLSASCSCLLPTPSLPAPLCVFTFALIMMLAFNPDTTNQVKDESISDS